MTRQEAVGQVVAIVKGAGLPIMKPATARTKMVPGVAVRLGWRKGTIDIGANGDDANKHMSAVVAAVTTNGWRVVYANPAGHAYSIARA